MSLLALMFLVKIISIIQSIIDNNLKRISFFARCINTEKLVDWDSVFSLKDHDKSVLF